MLRRFAIVGLLFVSLQPTGLWGATPDWLFEVSVPVPDRSFSARHRGGQLAIKILLTRLTGMQDLPSDPRLEEALKTPETYLLSYSYVSENTAEEGQIRLTLGFDPVSVQKLIRSSGLPLWSSGRPNIVAWVVVENEGTRQLLASQSRHPLVLALEREAAERGLPLTLPLMDLEDQLAVSPGAVWGGLTQVLEPASVRYQADAILVGRVRESFDGWSARWNYYEQPAFSGNSSRQDRQFRDAGPTPEELAVNLVDFIASDLVARYAVGGDAQHRIWFQIDGIESIETYAQAMDYFGQLDYLNDISLIEVTGSQILLSLTTQSPWPQLRKLLALDARLAFVEPRFGVEAQYNPERVKRFHWQSEPPVVSTQIQESGVGR